MNAFFASYVAAAVQVTLLGLVAFVLHRFLARRRPETALLILVTTSVLTILTTVAAVVPLPRWWAVGLQADGDGQEFGSLEAGHVADPASADNTPENVTPPAFPALTLLNSAGGLLQHVRSLGGTGHAAGAPLWPAALAAAILAAIGVLSARFVGGLWSARRLLRSACRITDPQLVRRASRLRRELGCARAVHLFTSPAIESAATIGWRRPILLLSPSWRTWSDVELTAVLAHELTHVRRRDYLLGTVARVAVVAHFYNPLVRWIVRSISFAQEAVADEAAARAVGGRKTYLVVLSRLALRQDRQFHTLPVLAFAFTSSTFLMRRIQMLQTTDGRRRSSRTLHAAVFGLLVFSAAAASTLRQRAHSEEHGQDDVRVANKTDAAIRFPGEGAERRPSIDLSYLPEAKQGLLAIRPKALFARSDMQPVTALIDAAIKQKLAELGVDEAATFSVAELEQALGTVVVEVLDPNGGPGERGRLMVGLAAARSEKRLPVKELLEATHPGTTTTEGENGTVIETPEAAIPAFGPMRHFAMPDEHTVLPGISGQALTKLAERPASEQVSAKPWFELWQRVEQYMFAIVLDNSRMEWNDPWTEMDYPEAKALVDHTRFLALGCDLQGDKLNVQLILECADPTDTDVVADSLKKVLRRSIRELEKQSPAPEAADVLSIRSGDDDPVDESLDPDYLRRLYVSVLQALEEIQPHVDAGRVSLEASLDVDVTTFAALAASLAGELGASAK